METEILSRLQFAFTVTFHIVWPTLNIGLSLFLLICQILWIKTADETYKNIYQFWVKIFGLAFGIGVVSGIALSYEFGTNFSEFSRISGNIVGPLIGVEVMTAFFLEATFIGVMLFGMDRVPPLVHLMATLLVTLGNMNSAFWILVTNSWMQTPTGVEWSDGVLIVTNWWDVIFNPSMYVRVPHMIIASYITGALMVCGVSSYYILKKRHKEFAQKSLKIGLILLLLTAPLQLIMGDMHGLNTKKHQPAKIAAMEGLWHTTKGAPLLIFGIPDHETESNKFAIEIPKLSSLILTHSLDGEVQGITEWPPEERPPMLIMIITFRIMVGLGLAFAALSIWGGILYARDKLYNPSWFHKAAVFLSPMGFVAVIAGWFTTEIGRQPYVIYGLLKTKDALSPIQPQFVGITLAGFILVYSIIFFIFMFYMLHIIKTGPKHKEKDDFLKLITHTAHITDQEATK